jgi:hypothetical protein
MRKLGPNEQLNNLPKVTHLVAKMGPEFPLNH